MLVDGLATKAIGRDDDLTIACPACHCEWRLGISFCRNSSRWARLTFRAMRHELSFVSADEREKIILDMHGLAMARLADAHSARIPTSPRSFVRSKVTAASRC